MKPISCARFEWRGPADTLSVYKWLLGDTDADDIENADIGACRFKRRTRKTACHLMLHVLVLKNIAVTRWAALAFIIFGFFTVLVPILMLNVLIAMFNK